MNLITGRCNDAISKFRPKSLNHSFYLDLSHILLPLQLNHITASSLRGFTSAPTPLQTRTRTQTHQTQRGEMKSKIKPR